MKILLDSNILISAALNSKSTPYRAFLKAVTYPNKAVICEQNIEEMKRVFQRKFPQKIKLLDEFIMTALLVIEVIPIPANITGEERNLRDISDRPILRAAISSNVDIILTGDKDFLESEIKYPQMLTASEFINM